MIDVNVQVYKTYHAPPTYLNSGCQYSYMTQTQKRKQNFCLFIFLAVEKQRRMRKDKQIFKKIAF